MIIKRIGQLFKDNKLKVVFDDDYDKAMDNTIGFSHFHIFYVKGNNICSSLVKLVDYKNNNEYLFLENQITEGHYDLIDIKPYIPCEDSVNELVTKTTELLINLKQDEIKTIGKIHNKKGKIYLEINDFIVQDKYLKVYWWFDRFDTKKYRSILHCNPPYENAPRSGIFATRSPVRPNPIAVTIVKVTDICDNLIYINGIEAFDNTPIIGICGYDSSIDYVENPIVPSYLSHWPKWIDFSDYYKNLNDITIYDSKLISMIKEHKTNIKPVVNK